MLIWARFRPVQELHGSRGAELILKALTWRKESSDPMHTDDEWETQGEDGFDKLISKLHYGLLYIYIG